MPKAKRFNPTAGPVAWTRVKSVSVAIPSKSPRASPPPPPHFPRDLEQDTRPIGPFLVEEFQTTHGDRAIGHIIQDGTRLSGVNSQDKGFTKTMKLVSPDPFSVTMERPTSGPYAGKMIYVIEPEKPFPFMDLPLELQNIILALIIPKNRSIVVLKQYNGPRLGGGILKVNSGIRRIAAPIYYGSNMFGVSNIKEANQFLLSMGPNVGFITDIAVFNWSNLFKGVRLLAKFMNLRAPTDTEAADVAMGGTSSNSANSTTAHGGRATGSIAPVTKRLDTLFVPGFALYDFVEVAKTWVETQGNTVAAAEEVLSLVSSYECSNCNAIHGSVNYMLCGCSPEERIEKNLKGMKDLLLEGTTDETPEETAKKARKKTRLEKELEINMVF
ncbi:hypothetical protein B9Z65_6423 [Elsinoe australis]|uniref:Uncharacterized protein n=1 Tax=Elsinoe australis TaxID=40998 RepID=A0A2P8A8K7_9PEZI|nr:hypothetical protein B9Z65_6423 [Elsinoe australis]